MYDKIHYNKKIIIIKNKFKKKEVKQISAMVKDQKNIAAMCVKECSVFFPLGVSYFLVLHLGL